MQAEQNPVTSTEWREHLSSGNLTGCYYDGLLNFAGRSGLQHAECPVPTVPGSLPLALATNNFKCPASLHVRFKELA